MDNATPVSWPPDRPGSKGNVEQPLPPNSSSRPAKGAAPVLPSDHNDKGSRRGEGTNVFTPYADFGQEWTGHRHFLPRPSTEYCSTQKSIIRATPTMIRTFAAPLAPSTALPRTSPLPRVPAFTKVSSATGTLM